MEFFISETDIFKSETEKNGISKIWNGINTILKRKNRKNTLQQHCKMVSCGENTLIYGWTDKKVN